MLSNPDKLDPDWHKYPDTVLHFKTSPAVRIDLRKPVGKDGAAALRAIGLEQPFAVLTAQDPGGRDESADINEKLAAKLDRRLVSEGARFLHVDACSPDGSHCESSMAVSIDREAATALGRELEQVAIFWYDGERFWIVGALVGGDPVMLPRPV